MRKLATGLTLALAMALPAAAQVHVETRDPDGAGPTNSTQITEALEDIGRRMAAMKAQGPRTGRYDLVLPASPDEYEVLGGYGALVVSVVVADPAELPLKRVYIHNARGDFELTRAAERQIELPQSSSLRATVGSHRGDELYILPALVKSWGGDVMIDFGANRDGFRIGVMEARVPDSIAPLVTTPTKISDWNKFKAFVQREYPGLFGP